MKKTLLLSLVTMLFLTSNVRSQDVITNHSFEEWDTDPVGWINPLSMFGILNVVQSSDAQHGESSAHFIIVWDDNTSSFIPTLLNSLPIPVTEVHSSLHGYFKGTSVEGDELSVTVLVYNNGLIAGTGSFTTSETVSDWTPFTVPISSVGGNDATEAYIYISVSSNEDEAHEGSEYMVDNLSWDGPASGIRDLRTVTQVTMAPVPADDQLRIEFTLEQPDHLAIDLVTPQGVAFPISTRAQYLAGQNTIEVNTSDLPSGIYILRARGERYGFVEKFVVNR